MATITENVFGAIIEVIPSSGPRGTVIRIILPSGYVIENSNGFGDSQWDGYIEVAKSRGNTQDIGVLQNLKGSWSNLQADFRAQALSGAAAVQTPPPATAAQTASDDAPQGPTKPPQQVVGDNGRVVPPPDTSSPTNAVPPTTSDTPDGATTGTDAPVRTTEQTQAVYYENDGSPSTSSVTPVTYYENDGTPSTDVATAPGTPTNDDRGVSTVAKTETAVNAGDYKLVKISPQPNVLDQYASYSYIASVYLMNDSQYKRLIASSNKKIDGYQLLFQSGGAGVSDGTVRAPTETFYENNGAASTTEPNYTEANRNPFFANDFYIDSISFETFAQGKGTGAAHNASNLKFTLIEPQGMTLLERLRDAVANHAPQGPTGAVNYVAATFLMVIRFYGYDKDGNIVQPIKGGMVSGSNTSDPTSIVEKFIPFRIKNINWTVGTKTVSYEWECAPVGQYIAGHSDRGTIPYDLQLNAASVGLMLGGPAKYTGATASAATPGATTTTAKPALTEDEARDQEASSNPAPPPNTAAAPTPKKTIVQGLMAAMNDFQQQYVQDGIVEQADHYEVEFVGPDANLISGASLNPLTEQKRDKSKTPAGVAAQDNPQALNQATNSVDNNSRSFSITAGQQLLQVIELVLRNSQYITKQALFEIDRYGNQIPTKNPKNTDQVKWYTITMSATQRSDKIDTKRNDFAYNIKYTISPYLIKNLNSVYFPINKFSGVHKTYPYWFTGQNTAVLEYQEALNVLYKATLNGHGANDSSADRIKKAQTSNLLEIMSFTLAARSGETSQGADGKTYDLTANAAEQLYDPASLKSAKVKILGDPAWIQQGTLLRPAAAATFSGQALTTGFQPDGSISFDNQDILFEINWQPPEDYDLSTGLADPYSGKQSATQKRYNAKTSKISRVYQAVKVTSEFKQGRFEQLLEGVLYQFVPVENTKTAASTAPNVATTADADSDRPNKSSANQTGATANRTGLTLNGRIQSDAFSDPRSLLSQDSGKAAILGATGAYKPAQFGNTGGGAAVGNPSITRQGITAGAVQVAGYVEPPTDGGGGNPLAPEGDLPQSPPKLPGRPIAPGSLRDIQRQAQLARQNASSGNPTETTNPAQQQMVKE